MNKSMNTKRALVLSGGGAKGAYEVGAIKHLYGDLGLKYDIVCGVSVGALNGSFISQYVFGDEAKASLDLEQLWNNINTKSIYKKWFWGRVAALWRYSVYNSKPLQTLVRECLNAEACQLSGKQLRVGAVSLNTGTYKLFSQDYYDLAGAVLASSSFPAMLCPIELDGELWTDGGVRDITPVKAAIDLGATEIDVVVCSPEYVTPIYPKKFRTLDIAWRSIEVMSNEILNDDIDKALLLNKLVLNGISASGVRNIPIRVIRPTMQLTHDSLDFSPSLLAQMKQVGYEDAKRVCASW